MAVAVGAGVIVGGMGEGVKVGGTGVETGAHPLTKILSRTNARNAD